MMLYPAMKDLLAQVPSRYQLVNVVAHRARQIAADAEEGGYPLNDKPGGSEPAHSAPGLICVRGCRTHPQT